MGHRTNFKRALLSFKLLFCILISFCLFSMSSANHQLRHQGGHHSDNNEHPWAKYVGVHSDEAAKAIKEENSSLDVHVVPKDSAVTMDFRPDRVRLFVDEKKHVVRTPTVG